MKKVSLNNHVRSEIMRRVMTAWREQQPEAERIEGLPTAEQLIKRDALKRREQEYRHQLGLALGTFRSVTELIDEWPAMERFVPAVIVDPVNAIVLPELPA